jgi:hypothetical protein
MAKIEKPFAGRQYIEGMGIWGIVAVVVVVLFAVWLWAKGGKADRAARRELRELRRAEKRGVNTSTIRERKGDMVWLSHLPGSGPVASTIDPNAHNPQQPFRR